MSVVRLREVYLYPWIRVFVICIFTGLVLVLLVAAATSRSRWLRKGGRIGEADPRYWAAFSKCFGDLIFRYISDISEDQDCVFCLKYRRQLAGSGSRETWSDQSLLSEWNSLSDVLGYIYIYVSIYVCMYVM